MSSVILGFLLSVFLFIWGGGDFDYVALFCVILVFRLLVFLVRQSVPVQVIDWKGSSPK